jgi:streptomycin 6-kinase
LRGDVLSVLHGGPHHGCILNFGERGWLVIDPVVTKVAHLERDRLLEWVLACAGLSAAWSLEDGDDPRLALAVAEMAAGELARE